MKLSDALRKYADDLDMGRPLNATMIAVVAADNEGHCNSAYFGPQSPTTPLRDIGIGLCAMGVERFLNGMTPQGRPLAARRST